MGESESRRSESPQACIFLLDLCRLGLSDKKQKSPQGLRWNGFRHHSRTPRACSAYKWFNTLKICTKFNIFYQKTNLLARKDRFKSTYVAAKKGEKNDINYICSPSLQNSIFISYFDVQSTFNYCVCRRYSHTTIQQFNNSLIQ